MEYVYFKDRFVEKARALVPIDDRSFRFGDGVFETLLVTNGKLYDASCHIARLQDGLKHFAIPLTLPADLQSLCIELIARNSIANGYIRIIVSRGINGDDAIGYAPADTQPYLVIQTVAKPFPAFQHIRLWVSQQPASLHLRSKVNSAMLYVMAMAEAAEHHCNNALILNAHGMVCETASGNLFWVKDHTLYTPATALPFIPGTVRRKILTLSPYPVQEGHFSLEDIRTADEVFMTNIGVLIAAVPEVQPLGFTSQRSDITQELRQLLVEDIRHTIG